MCVGGGGGGGCLRVCVCVGGGGVAVCGAGFGYIGVCGTGEEALSDYLTDAAMEVTRMLYVQYNTVTATSDHYTHRTTIHIGPL